MSVRAESLAPVAPGAIAATQVCKPAAAWRRSLSRQRNADVSKARRAWTCGLKTRTANALLAYGFSNRAQVAAMPLRRLRHIANLGSVSLADLLCWLGARETAT